MITLYCKDNKGGVRSWSIEATVDRTELIIAFGSVGGSIQHKVVPVILNQSGRSQSEQAQLEIASRVAKQRDRGYVDTLLEARQNRPSNALGLPKPMLAQPLDKVRGINFKECVVQFKYDGHRCLVHNDGEKLIAYSRNGKEITSIDHILEGMVIPEGVTVDGELYCHRVPLQTISSWVKRKQKCTEDLVYIVYDVMLDLPYPSRRGILGTYSLGAHTVAAPSLQLNIDSETGLTTHLKNAIRAGYEGLIVRHSRAPYEDGKRSKSLVKVKAWEDSSCLVVDINPSQDGWAILTCKFGNHTFKCSASGSMDDKLNVLANKEKYIGKMVKVEYANLTMDGVPFHPIAVCWLLP
jgi:ATP-dependent DNA ligase